MTAGIVREEKGLSLRGTRRSGQRTRDGALTMALSSVKSSPTPVAALRWASKDRGFTGAGSGWNGERKFRGGENRHSFRERAVRAVARLGVDQVRCVFQERQNSIHLRIHLRPCKPRILAQFHLGRLSASGELVRPYAGPPVFRRFSRAPAPDNWDPAVQTQRKS